VPRWAPWQASLAALVKPSIGFPPHILTVAFDDFSLKINREFNFPNLLPLSRQQVVCGEDGVKFVDAMKASTSCGFPINKPKAGFLTDIPEDDSSSCVRILDPMFWEEFEKMEDKYLQGIRCYPVFKGCLKDEATLLTKKKVRVFQAAPIALQLILRKYFLPICRQISLNPEIFECAVGINCYSREWDRLNTHILKFGKNRVVAGDFKTFDLKMPAQMVLLSFKIFINLAKRCGYDDRSLTIMNSVATDVAFPTIDYNGELMQFLCGNPSGQNLTVYTNSIVNSLYHRCAYYSLVLNAPIFHDVVSMVSYGDDCKMSVRKGFEAFNHTAIAATFDTVGITYTMADKLARSVPYINGDDAAFLKRMAVWSPALRIYVAALDEKSIFKSLHTMHRSSLVGRDALTKEQHLAAVFDAALSEWFFHGRDVYAMRRVQLRIIADKYNFAHQVPHLFMTYERCVTDWLEKYKLSGRT
jgi:hypothetical protein